MPTHKHAAKKTHHHEKHHAEHHHARHVPTHKPKTTFWIAGAVILLGLLYIAMNYSVAGTTMDKNSQVSSTNTLSTSAKEKKRIDTWIIDSSLNVYGDKKGTVYIGGTPLFNEANGKYIDLYEYILKTHPDRPWNK